MSKNIYLMLLITLLASCAKEDQNKNSLETSSPKISISEFEGLVETKTNFKVSITGVDEQTNTIVLINDNEVISTDKKEFEIEINPFDYPNGKTALSVKSTASNSQESVENKEFEIKKLLFRSHGGLSSESINSYLAINLESTGELVAFKKIITYDDPIFFAKDSFIEENIIVTEYSLGVNSGLHVARMFGNVKPGTELLTSQEVLAIFDYDGDLPNRDSSFNVNIEGTSSSGLFSLLGWSYFFDSSAFPKIEINYDDKLTSDIFLYYFNQADKNIIDNYRYSYITNFTDQTLKFDEMSTVQPSGVYTIDLPETVKEANLALLGYSSETEYKYDQFKMLFINGIEAESAGYKASYPILNEYPIIVKSINLEFLNGNKVLFNQRRNSPDITMPNLTFQKKDSIIEINGDHDFSMLKVEIHHPDSESDEVFIVSYRNQYMSSLKIPFESLEIPDEITQYLNGRGFEFNFNDLTDPMELNFTKYEKKDFPNGVFHFPIGRTFGDYYVDWTFPIEN